MCAELRPHHALCVRFFRGYGYSDGFCRSMESVIAVLMKNDPTVTLTDGTDMICSGCPKNADGSCSLSGKAAQYDRKTAELCGLSFGAEIKWSELYGRAYREIVQKGLLGEVCGDCAWSSICSALI